MTDAPTTDAEANVALQRDSDVLTDILQGLYRGFRSKGETVRDAFQMVLEANLAAIRKRV